MGALASDLRAYQHSLNAVFRCPVLRPCKQLAADTETPGFTGDHQAPDLRIGLGLQMVDDAYVDPADDSVGR